MASDKEPDPFKPYPSASRGVLDMLRNSQWKYLFIILIPGLVFIPVIFTDLCLGTLILPIMTVVLIWLFKVDKIVRQLIIGVVAFIIATLLISAVFPTSFSESANDINSSDGALVHGKVTPFMGGKGASYVFTISVVNTTPVTIIEPHVVIYEDIFGAAPDPRNQTMTLVSNWTYVDPITHNNRTYHNYSYATTLAGSVNGFGFTALIGSKWTYGAAINGPISSDAVAVFGSMMSFWIVWIFSYGFMQYIVLLLFLRFSSKSRETREKMLKEYKKKKEEAQMTSEGGVKGVSPRASVGTEDTFVCSECGADVQASAKFCPNCGEPFDEDEDKEEKSKKA